MTSPPRAPSTSKSWSGKENRQQVVSQLSNQIQQQRQQLGKLQADEQRTNALIDKINRELGPAPAKPRAKAEEARKLAQAIRTGRARSQGQGGT